MARGRKKKQQDDLGPKRLPSADEVKHAVDEVRKNKAFASEHSGTAGADTKAYTERYGVSRWSFGAVVRLSKLEPIKAEAEIRDLLMQAQRYGLLSQGRLFDDLGEDVRDLIADAAIGNDGVRAARTEAELAEPIPAIDGTVSERLREQKEWDTAGEVAKAKKAVANKPRKPAGAADKALSDDIDNTIRPN